MLMFKLTNISGGLIVCNLATEGNTLRLNNKQYKTIPDTEITPHIRHLESLELVLIEEVSQEETGTIRRKNTQKSK